MNADTRIWSVIVLVGLALVAIRCLVAGEIVGKQYVREVTTTWVQLDPDNPAEPWVAADSPDAKGVDLSVIPGDRRMEVTTWAKANPIDARGTPAGGEAGGGAGGGGAAAPTVRLSYPRTIGLWFAAFLTLAIFSFLYKDNPFYKIAEAVFIGVSAAFYMVVSFHEQIIPNLLGKISPEWVRTWAIPGLKEERNWFYVVPLVLGVMLLMRLSPKGSWIARWPLALFIGVFCGLRLTGHLHGDFLNQIRNAIVPVYALNSGGGFDFWLSLKNVFLIGGVLVCLVYFFFSFEHKGIVGHTARVGIWVLMITFGAGFGYTVMGRIAVLAIRLEFLFDDWMWLIDPDHKRTPEEAAAAATALADALAGLG